MNKVVTIARNTIGEILRRKILWVGVGATLVFSLQSIAILFDNPTALSAADLMMRKSFAINGTITLFQNWTRAAIILSAALGSLVLSWEIQQRTILIVLSRPVHRAEFLLAKWLGVLVTTLSFLAAGVVLGHFYAWYLGVPVQHLLVVALASTVASIVCFSAVSLALSISMSSVTAAAVPIFMYLAPDLLKLLFDDTREALRLSAIALYYAFPAALPINLVSRSFGQVMLVPNYGLYTRTSVENILYGVFVFAAACYAFGRREVSLD
jgi:Cu-processing system permease protein